MKKRFIKGVPTRYGVARQVKTKGLIPAIITGGIVGFGTYFGYRIVDRHGFWVGYEMGSPDRIEVESIVNKVTSGMSFEEAAKDFKFSP